MLVTGFLKRRLPLGAAAAAGLVVVSGYMSAASAQMPVYRAQQRLSAGMLSKINREAKPRMLTRRQLTPGLMAMLRGRGAGGGLGTPSGQLGPSPSGRSTQAYGSGAFDAAETHKDTVYHYTDSLVYGYNTVRNPMRRTGHFAFQTADGGNYRCTASLISRSIIVTAGHCVHDGGSSGSYITGGAFYPARYSANDFPYGYAPATHFIATTGWTTEGNLDAGYDVGLAALDKRAGTTTEMGNVVGWYGFCANNCLQNFWYLTQLGYPHNYYNGVRMTMGQHLETRSPTGGDYIFGSGMQGGSSGGPHIANLGYISDASSQKGLGIGRNIVFAVTSWGFVDEALKIQGASSLSGPNNQNDFKTMFNSICDAARSMHGVSSCNHLR